MSETSIEVINTDINYEGDAVDEQNNNNNNNNNNDDSHSNIIDSKNIYIILDTGGTIGMVRESNNDGKKGALRVGGTEVAEFLERKRIIEPKLDNFEIRYLNDDQNLRIDSSNANYETWELLNSNLENLMQKENIKGIVICHGTDTLAYSAAAVAFGFEYFKIPIMFTAAQYSLSEPYNDAELNLFGACLAVMAKNIPPDVFVWMNNTLMLGVRIQKKNASDIDAFHTPNAPRFGIWRGDLMINSKMYQDLLWGSLVSGKLAINTKKPYLKKYEIIRELQQKLSEFKDENEDDELKKIEKLHRELPIPKQIKLTRVGLFYLYPSCEETQREQLEVLCKAFKGIVIAAYGAGNGPEWLTKFIDEHPSTFFLIATQCQSGWVSPVYESSLLDKPNVGGAEDMTIEASLLKLSYLLSKVKGDNLAKRFFFLKKVNLHLKGELTAFHKGY